MNKLIALSIMAGFALLVAPSQANACRCMLMTDPVQKAARAGAVFSGKLTSVTGAAANTNGVRFFHFAVARGYKGIASKTVTVRSYGNSATCGATFDPRGTNLVYASLMGRELSTSSCAGNTSGATAAAELPLLGQYWAPTLPNGACPAGTANVIRCIRAPCPVKCMSTNGR